MRGIGQLVSRSHPTALRAALLTLLLAALALSPSLALAQQAPGTPSSVTVTRGDGTLNVSWSAVAGATGYNVNTSDDGKQSWKRAKSRVSGTSTTLTGAINSATYVVAVQAVNDKGGSGWRNSASVGPYTPTPPPTPPGTPSSVSITRSDGTLTATWPAVAHAASYHVTYSSNHGGSWSLAAFSHTSNSITISGVENESRYLVGVRARNQHGWSGWRNSALSSPYYPPVPPPPAPTGLTAGGGPQRVTLAWDRPIDIDILWYQYQYRDATSGSAWSAWISTPKDKPDITSHTITGLTNGREYRFKLRAIGGGGASASAPTAAPWYVAATPVDGVSIPDPTPGPQPPERPATVTLSRGAGTLTADWPDAARATSYHVTYSSDGGVSWSLAAIEHAVSAITLTGVSDSATYIVAVRGHNSSGYGPWRNSAPIGPFDQNQVSVQNLDETAANACPIAGDSKCAVAFTTGNAAHGYTLVGFTATFKDKDDDNNALGDIVVTLHADNSGVPAAQTLATLSGDNPDAAGDYAYACSTGCALASNTTYFAQFAATGGNVATEDYGWATTNSDDQTLTPSGNGWSLANGTDRYGNGSWYVEYADAGLLKVTATANSPPPN